MTSSRIETHTGGFVNPLDLQPGDVNIADIAHSLSMQCRFTGMTSRHYSVAEHSVNVMRVVAARFAAEDRPENPASGVFYVVDGEMRVMPKRQLLRQALLHDAPEAWLPDMAYPIKYTDAMKPYRDADAKAWEVIAKVYDVPVELHPWVKEADRRMATTEKFALMSRNIAGGDWPEYAAKHPPYLPAEFEPDLYWEITPRQARKRFLDAFDQVAP